VTQPLEEHAALFRTFADLDPADRSGILDFANSHGLIGVELWRPCFLFLERGKQVPVEQLPREESHIEWAWEISRMKQAVALWDLITARDSVGLSRLITQRNPGVLAGEESAEDYGSTGWFYDSHPGLPDGEPGLLPVRMRGYCGPPEADLLTAANGLLWRWINTYLKGSVVKIATNPATGKPVLNIIPNRLLSALWLQLARAITGSKQYRSCRECGKWFELSGDDDGRTARRMFCSDPCKSRDYRRRKDRALALKGRGRTPRQIAERLAAEGLETDPATVRKWVGGRGR
jgi:hypothetical protein